MRLDSPLLLAGLGLRWKMPAIGIYYGIHYHIHIFFLL